MPDTRTDKQLLGTVKWFGGYNHQKGKENDFGFISSQIGNEIFVHKSELKNCGELNEGDLVSFELGEKKGKSSAKNVYKVDSPSSAMVAALRIYIAGMESTLDYIDFVDSYNIDKTGTFRVFEIKLASWLLDEDDAILSLLKKEAIGNPHVYVVSKRIIRNNITWEKKIFPRIIAGQSITELVRSGVLVSAMPSEFVCEHEKELFECISELDEETRIAFLVKNICWLLWITPDDGDLNRFLKHEAAKRSDVFCAIRKHIAVSDGPWEVAFKENFAGRSIIDYIQFGVPVRYLPRWYMDEHAEELYNFIDSLDGDERKRFVNDNIDCLPSWVVLACEFSKPAIEKDSIGDRSFSFDRAFSMLLGYEDRIEIPAPDFAIEAFHSSFSEAILKSGNSGLWQIIEPLLFKKHLFEKRTDINEWFDTSRFLKSKIEFFILAKLFSLIQASNDLETAYAVFLHRLWKALVAEEINLDDKGVFNLFPSCSRMDHGRRFISPRLSCESFYWASNGIFLCRGKECTDPQVLPSLDRHYLDFSIYDWFRHFGINYSVENKPAKKDFPVKLAGYINRLKEIFSVLHCRSCNKVMKPEMRYARVQYQEYRGGELVTVNTSAAYRVTVFECGNLECPEYESKYYINHCIGFGCDSVIDSRHSKVRCDAGLYICFKCGSCCSEHGETTPVGLCPDCGNTLRLFENLRDKNRYGRYARYVECSNPDCEFEMRGELPKKFYMEWCTPVVRVNR